MIQNVGVIGSGVVSQVLADGFLAHGYTVMRGSRDPRKLAPWKQGAGLGASTGDYAETSRFGELIVLAVKGSAAEEAVKLCGPLDGKIVIDTTNPITDGPPEKGVLPFFTSHHESLMERLQRLAPNARFVKAFSCVGNAHMVNPDFPGGPPTMFICGNDDAGKAEVRGVLSRFGWDTEDMGGVEAARAIEPLCMLWCIPGFARDQWSHAFKLLKPV